MILKHFFSYTVRSLVRSDKHQLTLSKISERQLIKFSAENEGKQKRNRDNFEILQYCLQAPLIYELLCVRFQTVSLNYLNMKVKYFELFRPFNRCVFIFF